jgi:hypothetical protein
MVMWLPEIQRILYIGPLTRCTSPCVTAENLYLLTLDGQTSALTHLETELPTDVPDSPFSYLSFVQT